jgi:hypothetical protein
MQPCNKTLRFSLLFLGVILFVSTSCLKKIERTDDLNTNIFDREYSGDIWYEVKNLAQVTNDLGQIRARFSGQIYPDKLPTLKPSAIYILAEGTGFTEQVIDLNQNGSGNFPFSIDLPYVDGLVEYCITLSIYDEDQEIGINPFSVCRDL